MAQSRQSVAAAEPRFDFGGRQQFLDVGGFDRAFNGANVSFGSPLLSPPRHTYPTMTSWPPISSAPTQPQPPSQSPPSPSPTPSSAPRLRTHRSHIPPHTTISPLFPSRRTNASPPAQILSRSPWQVDHLRSLACASWLLSRRLVSAIYVRVPKNQKSLHVPIFSRNANVARLFVSHVSRNCTGIINVLRIPVLGSARIAEVYVEMCQGLDVISIRRQMRNEKLYVAP